MIRDLEVMDAVFFLDFDGVICDSIRECFVSSWHAFHRYKAQDLPVAIQIDYWKAFCSVRPFIRTGEDYLLVHDLLLSGKTISSQEEFDREKNAAGIKLMSEYKNAMLAERERVISSALQDWISLHSLYPGHLEILRKAGAHPSVRILSTKKASLISEILAGLGVDWPPERIHYSGNDAKLSFIRDLMDRNLFDSAVFVDDQKDHFTGNTDPAITCLLASWGYVKREWLEKPDVELITLEQFQQLLKKRLARV